MTEERAARRHACHLPVTVYSDGSRTQCNILDISERGCKLIGDVFGLGNEVEVHLPDARLCIPGRVVWKTFDRAGVSFKATIGVAAR